MIRMAPGAVAMATVCVLSACAGGEVSTSSTADDANPSPTANSASPSFTYTPPPEVLLPDGQACYKNNGATVLYDSFKEAWKDQRDYCETEDYNIYYEPTSREARAVDTAYKNKVARQDVLSSLVTLYDLCAQSGSKAWSTESMPYSKPQIREVQGMLVLCPRHPDRGLIEAGIAQGRQDAAWEKQGRSFSGGTFRVGKDIQPGTYYSPGAEGCYWQRTDSSGNIIDNNFTMGATRVQVTISPSDYSFTSEGCGTWKPL